MSPPKNDDRDRDDRPSWSEIDKMRDKSPHRKEKSRDSSSVKEKAAVKAQALKQAQSLFNKTISPDAKKAVDEIFKAKGKKSFAKLVTDFIETFGLPDEWTFLLVMLEHPDETIFEQVAERMEQMYPDQKSSAKRSFKSQLSMLSMTSSNSEIGYLAGEIKNRL